MEDPYIYLDRYLEQVAVIQQVREESWEWHSQKGEMHTNRGRKGAEGAPCELFLSRRDVHTSLWECHM